MQLYKPAFSLNLKQICVIALVKKIRGSSQMTSHFHCRTRCDVPHAECKATNHEVACVCKEGFHGNGTESCVPDGFTEEENGTEKITLILWMLLQWRPLNVITINVISRLLWSNFQSPVFFIQHHSLKFLIECYRSVKVIKSPKLITLSGFHCRLPSQKSVDDLLNCWKMKLLIHTKSAHGIIFLFRQALPNFRRRICRIQRGF